MRPSGPEGPFTSRLHTERVGAILGIALGVTFGICFLTGVLSHFVKVQGANPGWFGSRPAGLYRVTEGLHVAAGIASIPLLLAKLWTVYPHLWRWPPVASVAHALERAALVPLVGGSLFLLFTGVSTLIRWYPYPFSFPPAHFWAAWITIGALIVHVGAKATSTRLALSRRRGETLGGQPEGQQGLSRRAFLGAAAAAAGLVTVATVGQTFGPLAGFSVLAPRDPRVGPQGFPVNRTAREARVEDAARDPGYVLVVEGNVRRPLRLSLADLRALPQREATLPIACVDGWSASRTWRGVPMRELLAMAAAGSVVSVHVESLEERGAFSQATLNASHALDPDTILALEVDGEVLHIDHGYPVRLIAPNQPGELNTKWVGRLVVA